MARADRTGKRKPRASQPHKPPELGYYLILTDTEETEKAYLDNLRDTLPRELRERIVIQVPKAVKTSKLVGACLEKLSTSPQYAEPWIVFDRDRVPNFDKIIENAHKNDIHVGWSNPCIEIWFDAYFGSMHSYLESTICCSRFSETFEHKTGREYHKNDTSLYTLLTRYGDEDKAIRYADNRLRQFIRDGITAPSKMCPCTTLHTLIKEIRQKISSVESSD